jgi:MFS family permease
MCNYPDMVSLQSSFKHCIGTLTPSRGKTYGIFNAKWLYIAAVVIFEAGSAVCGAAPNMNALIVGRAVAGIGVGFHSPRLIIIFSYIYVLNRVLGCTWVL